MSDPPVRPETEDGELRYCICADPENCRETVPGYVCRKESRMVPVRPEDRLAEILKKWQVVRRTPTA